MPLYSWRIDPRAGQSFFQMAGLREASYLIFLYFFAGMTSVSAQVGRSVPTTGTIVARMARTRAERRARLLPYIVTREYRLFGKDDSKAKSEVIADVAFVPPDSKTYSIQEADGSGLGKIIVRLMLAGEADVAKDYTSTDISADNYDFRFVRAEEVGGRRFYVLAVLPRRNEKHLLRGDIWVDANTYLLRRFEGTLAKNPSWWVRDVRLTFVYGDVGGMWLQTSSRATANVRILGRSTVVSRDVTYKIAALAAAASSAQTNFPRPAPDRSDLHRMNARPLN
jgi:hypothetical protein